MTVPSADAAVSGPVLRVDGLGKAYGDVAVLAEVDLEVSAGEIVALLGENGAGKSTLIKILSGVVTPDSGQITVGGQSVTHLTPHTAAALGIATLHQELAIVPGLSVAENVLLGRRPPQTLGRVRWRELEAEASALLEQLGQRLDVRQDAGRLRPVEATMVAIARAMSREARVLVLDEPTASLTDREAAALFAAVRRLAARGVAVVYVSHRLEEVLELCDRWVVLRSGRVVGRGAVPGTAVRTLIDTMAGRPIETLFPERGIRAGELVLEARALVGRRLRGVDVDVRAGEVLGVAGLAGSGRSELMRLLGALQQPSSGTVALTTPGGRVPLPRTPKAAQRAGVVLVPQERRADALIPDSIERNLTLSTLPALTRGRVLVSRTRTRRQASAAAAGLDVRYAALSQPVLQLSGGNQQKVVLARFLALDPRILLLDEPTRGVDVTTKTEIYRLIRSRTAAGIASVVASSDLLELLGLADRVLVLMEGRSQGVFDAATTSEHDLLTACYGKDPS